MFEKPSTEKGGRERKSASPKKGAVLGAAMIAGIGVSDPTYAEQDN